jgi:hypothetical protein
MNIENLTKHQKEVLQRLNFDDHTFSVDKEYDKKGKLIKEQAFIIFPYNNK